MEPIYFLAVVAIVFITFFIINTMKKKGDARRSAISADKQNSLMNEIQQLCDYAHRNQKLPEISVDLNLKKGEKAYFKDSYVTLSEERSKSVSNRGGAAVRVAKGLYIGGSQSVSRSYPELRQIDSGELVFTNQRVVFIGSTNTREYPLNKILKIESKYDGIVIAEEGKAKKSILRLSTNPGLWYILLRLQRYIDNGEEIPEIKLDFSFE